MDEDVDEAVSGVHLTRHRAVRHRDGRLHGARTLEGSGRFCRGRVVRRCRIVTDLVAVEPIAHLLDRLAVDQWRHPPVAADDVVQQRAHVHPLARRRRVELRGTDAVHDPARGLQRAAMQLRQ